MSINFPARHSEKFTLVADDNEVGEIITRSFDSLGWSYSVLGNYEFLAKTALNFWSFGESVEVKFVNGEIDVCSRCVYPLQCFDWGKNRDNVQKLRIELEANKRRLLASKTPNDFKAFDEKGQSPVDRMFADSE